ncbi:uncharacterized protein [Epargyreus clarus]|uniref:uncharacterized protein n=1 Tax=Epargyreus clarus TaxID=520877 RepID=UPI003C2F93D0
MRMYLIFLFAPILLCGGASVPQPLIDSVFGRPPNTLSIPAADQATPITPNYPSTQAVPVTPVYPNNQSLDDIDYYDMMDEYLPTDAEYDMFDLALTKRIASLSSENFLLSPLCLKLSMAILSEAATGPTRSEVNAVLGFDNDMSVVRQKFSRMTDSLQTKLSRYILNLASRIYVGNYATISQRYASIAHEFYKTDISNLDFSQPKLAAKAINTWVSNSTMGRITDLVDEDDVAGAILLVINTLFFKGTWRHQFLPNATKTDIFYVTPTVIKETSFMTLKNKFYYTESTRFSAKILRLPYLGSKFAFYIVLPDTLTGLNQIINDITGLRAELLKLREHLVAVTLPKFQFEYTTLLDDILREMGIRQAFEDTASFPGISRGNYLPQRLKISKVLQRSGIEVNELGSVAYSATEISIVNKFGEDVVSNAEMIANRPFLFFIQDEATKQMLFMGRLSDPTISNGNSKSILIILATLHTFDCQRERLKENSRLHFFDIDLLRYATEDNSGNVMISPASIKSTLAMILEGARGNTESEIRSALRLSPNKEEYREQLNLYLSLLMSNKTGTLLHNANAVFVSNKLQLKRDYELMLRKVYHSEVRFADFKNPIAVADLINGWTSANTNAHITHVVGPGDISATSDMVLTNAMFFRGTWQRAFDPRHTQKDCFFSKGTCIDVAMMFLSCELNYTYVDNLRAHAVELPYQGRRYSMILLVPQDRDGLASVIRDLPYMSLPQISQLLQPSDVFLYMPKFTVDYNENMVAALKRMEINTLFSKDADLSGMYENGSPTVNSVLHKVQMTVDEQGTVAAAATAAMVIPLIDKEIQLRVDRPFLFFIRDNDLGLVLFEGKIENPFMPFYENQVNPEPVPRPKNNRRTFSLKRIFG